MTQYTSAKEVSATHRQELDKTVEILSALVTSLHQAAKANDRAAKVAAIQEAVNEFTQSRNRVSQCTSKQTELAAAVGALESRLSALNRDQQKYRAQADPGADDTQAVDNAINEAEEAARNAKETAKKAYLNALSVLAAFNFNLYPPQPGNWASRVTVNSVMITGEASKEIIDPGKAVAMLTGQKLSLDDRVSEQAMRSFYQALRPGVNSKEKGIIAAMDALIAQLPDKAPFALHDPNQTPPQIKAKDAAMTYGGNPSGYQTVDIFLGYLKTTIAYHKQNNDKTQTKKVQEYRDKLLEKIGQSPAAKQLIDYVLYGR